MFELYAERRGTRSAIVRLNYAIDLRYGVLVDIATRVFRGEEISLGMGHVNVIWQGDANRVAIECLPRASVPPFIVNVTGMATLSVRELSTWFGERFGKPARFTGTEGRDALLSNASHLAATFGEPEVSLSRMQAWVADWVEGGGSLLGKPTKFEARDGQF
jgi:hypothetical protein